MKNTTWQRLQPGQIVKFSYKSVDSKRGMNRTVLIIDPKYRYKKKSTGRIVQYVVGLQLDTAITPPINTRAFKALLSKLGGVSIDENIVEVGDNPDKANKINSEVIYKSLKRFLKKNDVFRTFFVRECRKRRVFLLDDYKGFPRGAKDDIDIKRKIEETIKKTEEYVG